MRFLLIACLFFSACSEPDARHVRTNEWMRENGQVKVLATIGMIADLVRDVGGDRVDVYTLIGEQLDPHSYQPVKGDDEKLQFAELIFYNGLGLEHGPSLLRYLTEEKRAISLGGYVQQNMPKALLTVEGQIDPHIWMDVSLWSETIPKIVSSLSEIDPEGAPYYRARGQALKEELMDLHEQIVKELRQVPERQRYLVTSHDAFNYFTRAYLADEGEGQDLWHHRFAAPEGLAPDSRLSVYDIRLIIDHLKKYDIQVIFSESNVGQDSLRKILSAAKDEGLNITLAKCHLYGDAMGAPGSDGDSYRKMILHNARAIRAQILNQEVAECTFTEGESK